jgi:hypothetical protein
MRIGGIIPHLIFLDNNVLFCRKLSRKCSAPWVSSLNQGVEGYIYPSHTSPFKWSSSRATVCCLIDIYFYSFFSFLRTIHGMFRFI